MRFASFLYSGFNTTTVINPPDWKLANRDSVQCFAYFFLEWIFRIFSADNTWDYPGNEKVQKTQAKSWKVCKALFLLVTDFCLVCFFLCLRSTCLLNDPFDTNVTRSKCWRDCQNMCYYFYCCHYLFLC